MRHEGDTLPLAGVFMPEIHRLLILATALLATLANVGCIILGQAVPLDRSWPLLACVISTAASMAVFAVGIFLPRVQPAASMPSLSLTPESNVAPVSVIPVDSLPPGDPLSNKPLMQLVEECVLLFEELERLRPSLDNASQDFADHVSCRIQEILERSGVTIIAGDSMFDHRRHQQESADGSIPDGAAIAETQSPGFAVGRRVFRRARVKLAEIATTEKGPTL